MVHVFPYAVVRRSGALLFWRTSPAKESSCMGGLSETIEESDLVAGYSNDEGEGTLSLDR
jgi:hypothetical protein